MLCAARFVHLEHLFDLAGDVFLVPYFLRDLGDRFAVERLVRTVRSDDRKRVVFETATLQRVFRIFDTRSRVSLSASRFFASSKPPARSHDGSRESSDVELAV